MEKLAKGRAAGKPALVVPRQPDISPESRDERLARLDGSDVESLTLADLETPAADAWTLAQDLIDYLASSDDETLARVSFQYDSKAAECTLDIKQRAWQIAGAVVDAREAERAATTQTAKDGQFRRQKVNMRALTAEFVALANERAAHQALRMFADAERQRRQIHPVADPCEAAKPALEHVDPSLAHRDSAPQDTQRDTVELVRKTVAEVLADGDIAFEGWFVERARANAIRRAQSPDDRKVWAIYFDTFGCFACKRTDAQYCGHGLCTTCYQQTKRRLATIRKHDADGRQ